MNVLVWSVDNSNILWYKSLMALLSEKYSVDEVSVVINEKQCRIENASYVFYYYDICGRKVYNHKYKFYSQRIPVDKKLLESMNEYLPEILKMMDRLNIVSYERRWRLYIDILEYWNTYLDYAKIKIFIHYNIPHEITDYIIYCLCKIKNIKYVGYTHSLILGKAWLHNDIYDKYHCIKYEYDELSANIKKIDERAIEFYKKLRTKANEVPYYMKLQEISYKKHRSFSFLKICLQRLKKCALLLFLCWKDMKSGYNEYCTFIEDSSLFREGQLLKEYYEENTDDVDFSKKYIYVPINYQPEATTSPGAGYYVDILMYIGMLDRCVPDDMYLYVKEHPTTWFRSGIYHCSRNIDFYDRLKAMKHVRLITSSASTFDLMSNAKAIAVTTGTAGLEALLKLKPLICFADSYFRYAPGVFYVSTYSECLEAVNTINSTNILLSSESIQNYVVAMWNASIASANSAKHIQDAVKWSDNQLKLARAYFQNICGLL